MFVLGRGPALPAGGTTMVTLSNLPVHSRTPRYVALGLAGLLAGVGVWLAVAKRAGRGEARQALVKRRDTLLSQLEQLESKRRAGGDRTERLRHAPPAHLQPSSSASTASWTR